MLWRHHSLLQPERKGVGIVHVKKNKTILCRSEGRDRGA